MKQLLAPSSFSVWDSSIETRLIQDKVTVSTPTEPQVSLPYLLTLWLIDQREPFIHMHYHSVLSHLTETALTFPLLTRQATLHACLISTHAFFSFLSSIPLVDWFKITYVSWSQMRYILAVFYKSSNFESPDWSPSHVLDILDLSFYDWKHHLTAGDRTDLGESEWQ